MQAENGLVCFFRAVAVHKCMVYFPGPISGMIYKMNVFLLAKNFTKNPICNFCAISLKLHDTCIQPQHTKSECLYSPLKIAK